MVLGRYERELREVVLKMKKPSGEALARTMGRLLARRCSQWMGDLGITVVVPVPMHWFRYWGRGVNGPVVMASCLSQHLGVRMLPRMVFRHRNTFPQSRLAPKERFRNVRGAFGLRSGYVLAGSRVLLVDDVMTTGATCSAIAGILKRGGAAKVAVAVVARAEGWDLQ
jgi:ComF family protein